MRQVIAVAFSFLSDALTLSPFVCSTVTPGSPWSGGGELRCQEASSLDSIPRSGRVPSSYARDTVVNMHAI